MTKLPPLQVYRVPLIYISGSPPCYLQIDENIPVHLRFSDRAGYDDFHKAYQQMSKQWPAAGFPEFGPPR